MLKLVDDLLQRLDGVAMENSHVTFWVAAQIAKMDCWLRLLSSMGVCEVNDDEMMIESRW